MQLNKLSINNSMQIFLILLLLLLTSTFFAKDLDLIKEKSFAVKKGQLLTVKTDVGDIIIKTWDQDELFLKIYGDDEAKSKMEFSFDQDEKGVTVFGERLGGKILGWFTSIDLKYEIKVPAEFDLDLKTSGGDLTTKDLHGNFSLKTSGGDIYLQNTKGSVVSETSGGDIVLVEHNGSSELYTSGGDIQVNVEDGDVIANTSGGDILLKTSNGKVSAKTSGGDIELNYSGENSGIELRTSGGDISIKIPNDFNADVDLRTSGGDLTNNFSNNKMSKVSKSVLQGKFNNGGPQLICKTSGGDITVSEK